MSLALEISIIALLVLLNGWFAMSEFAVVSARRARLEARAAEGSTGARVALELAENPARFLSSVQIGITLVGILAGAFSGATLVEKLAAWIAVDPARRKRFVRSRIASRIWPRQTHTGGFGQTFRTQALVNAGGYSEK